MMNGQWTERDGNKQLIGGYTSSYSSQRYCSIVKNGPVRIVPYCSKFSTLIVPRYPIQTSIEDGPPTLGFFKLVATNLLIGLRMEPQRQPLAPVEVWASRGRHAGLGLDLRPYCTHTVLHLYTYYMLHLQLQLCLHFTFRSTFTRAYLHLDLNLQCITSQYSTARNSTLHYMHNMYTLQFPAIYDLNVI